MIVHEAKPHQPHGYFFVCLSHQFDESEEVIRLVKNIIATVTAIENVVNKTALRCSGCACHSITITRLATQLKYNVPFLCSQLKYNVPFLCSTITSGSALSGGRFRILRPHARGGLGQVSIAEDRKLHREVALKKIQSRYTDDADSQVRFKVEAKVTGQLEPPGICPFTVLGKRRMVGQLDPNVCRSRLSLFFLPSSELASSHVRQRQVPAQLFSTNHNRRVAYSGTSASYEDL